MALGFLKYIGVFLLLAAAALLLVATITAPVVDSLAMLKVTLPSGGRVHFGTFGHCVLGTGTGNTCSGTSIGYSAVPIMSSILNTSFNTATKNTVDALTRVQILHPIAFALAFLALLGALLPSVIGGLLGSILAFLAWACALAVTVTDFICFGILKNKINDRGVGAHAKFDTGMWCVLAAMICLFFAMFLVLTSCCAARRERRATRTTTTHTHKSEPVYGNGGAPVTTYKKKHFWQRKTARY